MKSARFGEFVPLREADQGAVDKTARTARCVLITEGLGNLRDRNYYTADAVRSAAAVFEGSQFFIDHPGRDEEEDRPERSVRDLAGYFTECQVGITKDMKTGDELAALYATLHFAEGEAGTLAMNQVATALEYQRRFPQSKQVYAGISVNAGGLSEPGEIAGQQVNVVSEFRDSFSADIVTKPARGGRFLNLMREAEGISAWIRREAEKRSAAVKNKDGKVRESGEAALAAAAEADYAMTDEAIDGFAAKLKKFRGASEASPDEHVEGMGVKELLADIMVDLQKLQKALGGGEAPADKPAEDIPPAEPADGLRDGVLPGGDKPADKIPEKVPVEAPIEEPGDGAGETRMRYKCAHCGEANEVLPPKGYQLVASEAAGMMESARAKLADKERRFAEANAEKRKLHEANEALTSEVIGLRAKVSVFEKRDAAAKVLEESGLPADVLSIKDLVEVDRRHWDTKIKAAKSVMAREGAAYDGGNGPKGAGEPERPGTGADAAVKRFEETYKKD